MTITVELLDALLSPAAAAVGGQASPREQAESHLTSMTVQDRASGLLSLLLKLNQQQAAPENTSRLMMSSVLLRRNIAALDNISLLKEMVEPILSLFDTPHSNQCRRQIGHCLAEICATLSMLSPSDSDDAMKTIISAISPKCMASDVESFRLLTSLADRAPVPLWRSGAAQNLSTIFQTASAAKTSTETMEALIEAVVFVGIASHLATSSDSQKDASLMLGGIQTTKTNELKVDPTSQAAQIGRTCLLGLLEWMVQSSPSADVLCKCMEHLSHSASTCPSLLAGDIETFKGLIRACMVVSSKHSHDTTRLSSLEVLATLCEVGDVKRGRLSEASADGVELRNALLVGDGSPESMGVIRICAELIAKGVDDDVEEWATDPATLVDDGNAWEEDDIAIYAEALLELFLHNLGGGSHSLPVVLPLVETLLADNQWKHQRAALSILERCLSAAPVTFARHVPVAMETALSLATNESFRVQYQAMNLLGALCEIDGTLGGAMQVRQRYGPRVLQATAHLVQSHCTKVASMACLSIVSYCRGGGQTSSDGDTLVVPYLKDILMALVAGPLSLEVTSGASAKVGAIAVKVRAIGAVACLAESSGESFVPFYGNVMPGLLACAQVQAAENSHELSLLRGAAIEAATIIGQALGESNRVVFVPDAEQIMTLALPLLNQAASGLIPMDQLLAACARVASVMGEAYSPFIQSVLPHLLNRATEPPDVSVTAGDEAGLEATRRGGLDVDEDEGTESMTVALPGRGLTKVTINTSKMQEISLAARAVYEHAQAMGAAFGPYAEASMKAFTPLVNFRYSSEVRSTAAQATAAIFEAACAHASSGANGFELPQNYLPLLGSAISKQILEEDTSDMEVLYAQADSLSEIYYSAFSRLEETGWGIVSKLSIDIAKSTVSNLMKAISACLARRTKITRTMEGHDGALTGEDEMEEYNELLSREQELLTPLVDCVGYTLKFFKEAFVSIFDTEVEPVLAPFLAANSDVRARFAAICLFDDCVEHCGEVAASKHAPKLAEGIVFALGNAANDQDTELLRVAIYGIAQIARYAPSDVLAPHAQNIISQLLTICKQSKDEAEDLFLLENAVSSLASMTLIGKAPFKNVPNRNAIIQTFVNHLPLREDEDEAKICHAGFCDLIKTQTINIGAEAPTVLKIIGDTLEFVADGEEIANHDTCNQFADILFEMQRSVQAEQMQQGFSSLSVEGQQAIGALMEDHARAKGNLVSP